jgi:hypothetical protein
MLHRARTISPLGLNIEVMTARRLSMLGLSMALLGTAVAGAMVFLGLGQDETGKTRARYGALLVAVDETELKPETEKIRVASMHDLARLAQRDGSVIFHHPIVGGHRYFIHEGVVAYEFVTRTSPTVTTPKAQEA